MKVEFYQVLHIFSVIMLFALTFYGLAAPTSDRKRRILIATGVLALIILVSGFGLIAKLYDNHFQAWMIVKMAVWLVVAALSGMAFRRPKLAGPLGWLFGALALIAVAMVYFKPSF